MLWCKEIDIENGEIVHENWSIVKYLEKIIKNYTNETTADQILNQSSQLVDNDNPTYNII
ncbi:MAG: hypothetical protein RCG15_03615 [Candidatus Rickettsia vulgarisii]